MLICDLYYDKILKTYFIIQGGFNLDIYAQNIYEVIQNGSKKHVLIIYNISANHYVGLTIHTKEFKELPYVKSINRFVDINDLQEYNKKNIKRIGIY